jgi:beta-glucosidase
MQFRRSDFPEDFLFGVATSAYQIEGHQFGGADLTHWDSFATTPGNVVRGEHGQVACDHYNRWQEDLDLIRDLGADVYRFSTSWARVLPDGVTANPEGLDFYDRLVDGMLARGLKPAATLYHWELPQPLADRAAGATRTCRTGSRTSPTPSCRRIGDRVWSAAPINEPWCVGWLSHFEGAHAPGMRDIRATARAMHHVLK